MTSGWLHWPRRDSARAFQPFQHAATMPVYATNTFEHACFGFARRRHRVFRLFAFSLLPSNFDILTACAPPAATLCLLLAAVFDHDADKLEILLQRTISHSASLALLPYV